MVRLVRSGLKSNRTFDSYAQTHALGGAGLRIPSTYCAHCGVVGREIADGYLKQQAYPFKKPKKKSALQATHALQAPVAAGQPAAVQNPAEQAD